MEEGGKRGVGNKVKSINNSKAIRNESQRHVYVCVEGKREST